MGQALQSIASEYPTHTFLPCLSQKTDLPVYIAEDPLRAVVRGTGITLKTLNRYKGILIK